MHSKVKANFGEATDLSSQLMAVLALTAVCYGGVVALFGIKPLGLALMRPYVWLRSLSKDEVTAWRAALRQSTGRLQPPREEPRVVTKAVAHMAQPLKQRTPRPRRDSGLSALDITRSAVLGAALPTSGSADLVRVVTPDMVVESPGTATGLRQRYNAGRMSMNSVMQQAPRAVRSNEGRSGIHADDSHVPPAAQRVRALGRNLILKSLKSFTTDAFLSRPVSPAKRRQFPWGQVGRKLLLPSLVGVIVAGLSWFYIRPSYESIRFNVDLAVSRAWGLAVGRSGVLCGQNLAITYLTTARYFHLFLRKQIRHDQALANIRRCCSWLMMPCDMCAVLSMNDSCFKLSAY